MLRLKKGDMVEVITGTEKGKRGQLMRVDHRKGKVIVQGVKLVHKHIRRSQKYPQGGRIQKEAAIDISNVLLVDPTLDHPVRTKIGRDKEGKRIRVSAKSGKPV